MITVNIYIKDRFISSQVGEAFGFKIVDDITNGVYKNFQDPEIAKKQ